MEPGFRRFDDPQQVTPCTMQSGTRRPGRAVEDGPDLLRRKLFPRRHPQDVPFVGRESRERIRESPVISAARHIDGQLVRRDLGREASAQFDEPAFTAPLIGEDAASGGQQPRYLRLTVREVVQPSPRDEERIRDGVAASGAVEVRRMQ